MAVPEPSGRGKNRALIAHFFCLGDRLQIWLHFIFGGGGDGNPEVVVAVRS